MPRYDFRCESCQCVKEYWAGMNERVKQCDECGGNMNRLISCTHGISADFASKDFVTDNITGDPVRITSNRQLDRLCKEQGVTPKIGKGWY